MKKKLFAPCVFFLIIGLAFFSSCEDEFMEPERNQEQEQQNLSLKKGGKKTEVDQADLYGDLWVMERDNSGVPITYELNYHVEYKDVPVIGIIDVVNPKLDEPFTFDALARDAEGYVIYESEENPLTEEVTVVLNDDGYVEGEANVIALYDAEGEIMPTVAEHVTPIEMGRLNIIRSPSSVISKRLSEVIKNFGDGTVANVTRDFCGRIMMLRTDAALDLDGEDKPIDSPLENLAIYKELLLNGFNGGVDENGLKFLIEIDNGYGGYDMQFRVDHDWVGGAKSYSEVSDPVQLIMNVAAACISAGSDKTNTLIIDEIVFVNLFMGVPEVIGNGIDKPATTVNCFLPTIEQEIRMMDKTDKHQYSRYRYYVDFSSFSYDRRKFKETLLDYVTIVGDYDEDGNLIGSHNETLAEDLLLDDILMGNAPLTVDAIATYRYTQKEEQPTTGALGFACQADDYVQALEVVHNNEEFLVWEIGTPTWGIGHFIDRGGNAPFNYVPDEESHGNKPDGHGDDDSVSDGDDGGSGGGRRGGRN
ncbi:hypothetical protein L3049_02245 [Labilibaculum sp. DW002]|uniref:Uncharacterized protein n=1 Tax=Paralabilibaculum antarcticum TaxID=2912572 RepID=A0ABT5VN00_9BACT|nr:hypothetical protein [Labilibaculum sp. DW002]MDE5416812.1 hypothetical protein [Labilibaculum sp. DW002]